jgi:spermidine/putrescine-binding protein
MKKFLVLASTLVLLSATTSCSVARSISCAGKETLEVFNWGEYVDPAVIEAFEDKYDICVTYSLFDDNETAITKMSLQSYDIVFPSDYAVQQLVEEGRIIPLDWSKITPTNKAGQIYSVNFARDFIEPMNNRLNYLKNNEGFDYYRYAAPYFFQNMTLAYNPDTVNKQDLVSQQWDVLKNPKYKVALRASSRDTFMIPLKQLGYSANTTNQSHILEAENWLKDQKQVMGNNLAYLVDEVLDDMPAEKYDIALMFSGDVFYVMDLNDKLDFYTPTKGTNIAIDGMVIPTDAKNKDGAYKFISHFLSYEYAKMNTEYVWYTTPLVEVYTDFLAENSDRPQKFIDVYTVLTSAFDEVYTYDAATKILIENAYNRVKAS